MHRQNGKPYSKQAYVGLRAGIQRHLSEGPWFLQYALVADPVFKESNATMEGMFKWLAKEGLDTVNHHEPIDAMDIAKLKATGVIGMDNPVSLQRLVWLGVALNFGRRASEGYRDMTKTFFVIKTDADGRRYMQQSFCEKTKKHQADKPSNSYMAQGRLYEQPSDQFCTLRAYVKYLSLLNADVDFLWQRPNKLFNEGGRWYHKQVIGRHMLGSFLKNMCKDAGITTVYTNHCTRVTTCVLLNEAGFGENDITHITGHKSTSSLRSYINKASNAKKRKMADTISNVFNDIPSASTSGMRSTIGHPGPALPTVGPSYLPETATPAPDTTASVNAPESPTILNFDLDNCEELTEADVNTYLESEENKENNYGISDKHVNQCMQMLFETNATSGGLFQGCTVTINNPVFNITIQK